MPTARRGHHISFPEMVVAQRERKAIKSLVRLKIIQCARETGWGWRAEMGNFACESIQATTVY